MTNDRRPFLALVLLGMAAPAVAQMPSPAQMAAPVPVHVRSGGLTYDRYSPRARQRIMALDTNHDGKISMAEFAARPAGKNGRQHDSAHAFNHYDTNHDGFIDAREIDAMTAKRFARMDANHDGVVTKDERAARHGDMPRP